MDSNSIITQVVQTTAINNNTIINTNNEEIDGDDASGSFKSAVTTISQKKGKRKGLFRTLFCCFTSHSHNNDNKSTFNSDTGTLIPGPEKYLLPPIKACDIGKKCLIIDLDETLVHSSFKPVSNADFIVPVEIEGIIHQVYVLKRPYVDEFLQKMGELYECVLFTASLAKYADPVANLLDKWGVFRMRLFREACVYYRGNYVKDLSKLGRDLNSVIICDNSPASYIFHPDNAVPVTSWFDDMNDTELMELIPFLEKLSKVDNVYSVLRQSNNNAATITANTIFIQEQQYSDNNNNDSYQSTCNDSNDDTNQYPIHSIQQSSKITTLRKSFSNEDGSYNSLSNQNTSNESYTINENSIVLTMDLTPISPNK